MIGKSLFAAAIATAALTATLPASEAKADVDVSIGIGVGGYYPGHPAHGGYYGYRGGYAYWRPEPYRMTCGRGANIVDSAGFHSVRPIDCGAPSYAYTAWKRGHKYVVRLNGYGAIADVRRVF